MNSGFHLQAVPGQEVENVGNGGGGETGRAGFDAFAELENGIGLTFGGRDFRQTKDVFPEEVHVDRNIVVFVPAGGELERPVGPPKVIDVFQDLVGMKEDVF